MKYIFILTLFIKMVFQQGQSRTVFEGESKNAHDSGFKKNFVILYI